MNELENRKLQDIVDLGYEFRFNEYLENGFNIFKQNLGSFVGFAFVFLAISTLLSFIPIIGQIGMLFVTYPLWVGFALVADKINRGEPTEFGDFFKGFDFVGQLVVLYLVMMVIYLVIMIPPLMFGLFAVFTGAGDPGDVSFPFWVFIFFIPLVYLGVSWRWAPMFIIFYRMGFWDAMETSRKIIGKQFWMHLLFYIVIGILAAVGALVLLVGLLFTLPLMACIDYAAFAEITRLHEAEEADGIIDHLVA